MLQLDNTDNIRGGCKVYLFSKFVLVFVYLGIIIQISGTMHSKSKMLDILST